MTVKEFKTIVKDWPEIGCDGEPSEVWLVTGEYLSSPLAAVELLNAGYDKDGKQVSDMLLTPQ